MPWRMLARSQDRPETANAGLRPSPKLALLVALQATSALCLPSVTIAAQQQDQTPAASSEAAGDQRMIRSISVIGAERLEAGTILSYVRLRVGQTYTAALGDEALKDLGATGLFADFSIRFERGVITLTVTENPVINRILLEGNKRIKQDKILPEIKLAPRQIFTRSKVRADVTRIIELYKRQGRFAATVEPKLVQLPQNRIDVVFEITEGPKSKVRKINVIGNAVFDDETIKEQMVTRENRAKNFLSSNTSYDPDRLAFDQQKLRQFYLTEGYADFRVVSAVAELTPDQQDFIITYVIEEGERYTFGDVSTRVELRDFDEELLRKRLPMQAGDWYDAKLVEDTVEQLGELAGTFGYAFTDIQPRFTRNREARTMDIAFVLRQTPRVYVERIDVNGNTLTRDKVIRREFRLAEGDAFNSRALRRSSNRIRSLGYFQENFEIEQKQGRAPDRIVLEANVEERPTGELQFSAGFSSVENLILAASVRQRNFGGRGQTVGLGINFSGASQSAQFSFTEPFLWDRNISFGFNLYQQNYDDGFFRDGDTSYEQSTTGGSVRFGVPLSEYSSLVLGYTLNFESVTLDENVFFADLDGDGVDTCEPLLAGRFLCNALGDRTVSIGSLSYTFSDLDNGFRPTRGTRYSLTGELAGLGGSVSYIRFRGRAARFWNLGGGLIASAQAEGGYIHSLDEEETRLTDRFFLGDPQFRGFDIRGLGPAIERVTLIADEDGDEEDGPTSREALGGNAYYLGRLELELPLSSGARELGLRPSLFLDVGSLFSLNEPQLSQSPFPEGEFIATRDDEGRALYSQTFDVDGDGLAETVTTISPIAPDGTANSALGSVIAPFREDYVGDTWRPRMTAGVGVNWNSPFGPFRIDLAFPILTEESDETQLFSFNVGTQF